MKLSAQRLYRLLWSRLARNVYFWAFMLISKVMPVLSLTLYPQWVYQFLAWTAMSFFIVSAYLNNLLLVPRLLRKKGFWYYLPAFILLLFTSGFCLTWFMKWIQINYPGIEFIQVSIISSPVDNDMSFIGIWSDMQTYTAEMFSWLLVFTLLWYLNDYNRQQEQMKELRQQQMQIELSFLRNQVNPHFLFNTMNNMYGLAIKKSDLVPGAILRLSNILRYLLYEADAPLVSFAREKEIMESYITLEKLRLNDSSALQFSVEADRDYNIPPLLWLPVLENVFKHGTRFIPEEYVVDFRFHINDNKLLIHSENRCKQSNATTARPGGIGLSNLKKRLQLLYPDRYQLDISSQSDYYKIAIRIELS